MWHSGELNTIVSSVVLRRTKAELKLAGELQLTKKIEEMHRVKLRPEEKVVHV